MTVDEIVRKQTDAFNRGDSTDLASLYATTAVVADPQYPEPLQGTNAIAKDYAEWFTAFPDARWSVISLLANGETYAVEGTMAATHLGPMVGPAGLIPATNKPVEASFAVFGRLDSQGCIAEEHRYYDLAGIMAQIGLLQ
jgi:steroid delta-isomerase-like uncharacterized protein